MKRSWWRTGPPINHTQPVLRPTMAQLLRQIAVLFSIAAVWGGILLVLLGATRSSNVAFVAERGTPERKATITGATRAPTAATGATAPAVPTTAAANTPTPGAATATLVSTGVATGTVSFARDVQPIFTQVCVKCHGGEKTQRNLVLKTYNDVMQGSENGSVVEPGDPGNSLLIDMIVKGKMPKNGPKLLPAQIRAITEWVKEGAPNN